MTLGESTSTSNKSENKHQSVGLSSTSYGREKPGKQEYLSTCLSFAAVDHAPGNRVSALLAQEYEFGCVESDVGAISRRADLCVSTSRTVSIGSMISSCNH